MWPVVSSNPVTPILNPQNSDPILAMAMGRIETMDLLHVMARRARNPIHLPEGGKDIELAVFEIRTECIKRMRLEHSSAARMCCLVCMAHVRLRAWLGGVGIPFRFKTLILFFFQTVNTFWIPFQPWCYLEFMQQNKITYAYVLINFSFSKNINNQSILLQHLSIHVQHFVHTVSTFLYKMFN